MIVGQDGPAVILSARTAAWLEHYAGLTSLRVKVRGTDPEISRELQELRVAALSWRGSATGTTVATEAELPARSDQWLTTGQAAELLGITSRGVRKAITEGRLPAETLSNQHRRVSREDLEHYRAARAA